MENSLNEARRSSSMVVLLEGCCASLRGDKSTLLGEVGGGAGWTADASCVWTVAVSGVR
jgi:hypothetical protein